MERPQPDELPLHHGVLSDATTSEEVLLNVAERGPGDTLGQPGPATLPADSDPDGDAGQDDSLSNNGGLG